MFVFSYHQVSDDHNHHEDGEAHGLSCHLHTVPHGLNPLPTQHSEHNQEGVEEVMHVPARQFTVLGDLTHTVLVAFAKQLHAHHGKYEDDDGQHQGQITQSSHWVTDDLDQHVQSGPWLGQFEDPQLF